MGVASLVLGIVGLIASLIGFGLPGAIMGIIGIVLASIAKKNGQGGVATAGMVLSILAVVFGLLFFIACAACAGGLASLA